MLVAAGSLYLFMGEPADALMLLGFVFVVMGITIVQERRTERALEALRDLSSPRALVIRDGAAAAHRRPRGGARRHHRARPRATACRPTRCCGTRINLSVDESLLTGESVPVRKAASADAAAPGPPGGDDLPFVFSGTLVTAGQGVAEVLATGRAPNSARSARRCSSVEPEATLLQKETGRLVRILAVVGLRLRPGGGALRPDARRQRRGLEGGPPGRHHHGHGHPAGGVPGRADHLPGAGRVAHLAQPGADAPHAGGRDAGRGDRPVRGQDRHAHPEPDVGGAPRGARAGRSTWPGLRRGRPRRFHRCWSTASWPASATRSTPWRRPSAPLGARILAATEHLHENWTLVREYPLSPELLALSPRLAVAATARLRHRLQGGAGGDRRPVPPDADQERGALAPRWRRMADGGPARPRRGRGRGRTRTTCPTTQHDFAFELRGPRRPGRPDPARPCPRRRRVPTRPGSGW